MKKRSIAAVILLPFVTLGIYTLYWYVSTKGELNSKGANIPTAWLIIVPFVNIWWMWKYFEGAQQVTDEKVNGILVFLLAIFITSIISSAICQDSYNKLSEGAAVASTTPPVDSPTMPDEPVVADIENQPPTQESVVPESTDLPSDENQNTA